MKINVSIMKTENKLHCFVFSIWGKKFSQLNVSLEAGHYELLKSVMNMYSFNPTPQSYSPTTFLNF